MLLPAVSHGYWSDLGLSAREVSQIRWWHGWLYACTNDGLYRNVSDAPDSAWVLLGFSGRRVHDVLAMSAETLLVAREVTGVGADTVALFRSTDAGVSWEPFQNGLGAGGGYSVRNVIAFLGLQGVPGTVLAAAVVGINKSTDGAQTWTSVSSAGDLYFLLSGPSALWAGGSGPAYSPFARRSTDGGNTWQVKFITSGDDAARSMAFDSSDPNVAFLGLSFGRLYRTSDNGASWTQLPLPNGVAPWALANRAFPPPRLYAGGFSAPEGSTFFKSDDGAASWTPVSFPTSGRTVEWTILVRSGPTADTLFIGTERGVLRYVELEVLEVDAPPRESEVELDVHPNPAALETQISFSLREPGHVTLRMLDVAGRVVATILDGDYGVGQHRITWNRTTVASGVYFCQLRVGQGVARLKVLIIR